MKGGGDGNRGEGGAAICTRGGSKEGRTRVEFGNRVCGAGNIDDGGSVLHIYAVQAQNLANLHRTVEYLII